MLERRKTAGGGDEVGVEKVEGESESDGNGGSREGGGGGEAS